MDEEKFTAFECHKVKNGWMVHPTRGWLHEGAGDRMMWDERIWVFETDKALYQWIHDRFQLVKP